MSDDAVTLKLIELVEGKSKATDAFVVDFNAGLSEVKIDIAVLTERMDNLEASIDERLETHGRQCPINKEYIQKEIVTAIALKLAELPAKGPESNKVGIIVGVVAVIIALISVLIMIHPLLK